MNFIEIANLRQSCRNYDAQRPVEEEKIKAVLEAAKLAPSACNSQAYHFTVCRGETAKEVSAATRGAGMNKFTAEVPVMIVVSEKPYNATAAVGAKVKNNDYRSIDIGLTTAYLTAEAAVQGLGTCILGWFDAKKIEKICKLDGDARLVIALGYAKAEDTIRPKKRKSLSELVTDM